MKVEPKLSRADQEDIVKSIKDYLKYDLQDEVKREEVDREVKKESEDQNEVK